MSPPCGSQSWLHISITGSLEKAQCPGHAPAVLVSCDCYRKYGGLKQQTFILSQFWRLQVWNRGVSSAWLPPKVWGEMALCLLQQLVAADVSEPVAVSWPFSPPPSGSTSSPPCVSALGISSKGTFVPLRAHWGNIGWPGLQIFDLIPPVETNKVTFIGSVKWAYFPLNSLQMLECMSLKSHMLKLNPQCDGICFSLNMHLFPGVQHSG